MYITDCEFIYDGIPSSFFGLRFAWVDGSVDRDLTSGKSYTSSKNHANSQFRVVGSVYNSPLAFSVEMLADRVLNAEEIRKIYRTFFERNKYKKLQVLSGLMQDVYFNCLFRDVERIEGGIGASYGVVGFAAKLECDAPWGWSETKIITPTLSNVTTTSLVTGTAKEFTIINNTDVDEYTYPVVRLTVPSTSNCNNGTRLPLPGHCSSCSVRSACRGGTNKKKVMIINKSDNVDGTVDTARGICILANNNSMDVVMNPNTGLITVGGSSIISRTNKKFIRLVPGVNNFYTENVTSLEFEYREARVLI